MTNTRALKILRVLTASLYVAMLLVFAGCGAKSEESISTDTGNPPVVDTHRIKISAGETGVDVVGESGSVSPNADVTVTNLTTDASASTQANADGAFEVSVGGSLDDQYEIDADGTVVQLATTAPNEPSSDLDGRSFLLQSSEGFDLVPGTSLSVSFKDGSFSFSADCNSHAGSYELCEDKLCVNGFESTQIGCPQDRQAQDDWLANFFSSQPAYMLDGNTLEFTSSGVHLVFLDEDVAIPDLALVGTMWTIDTLIEGSAASSVPLMPPPTITFNEDGSFDLFTTCITATGSYESSDSGLTITDFGYDEPACPSSGSTDVDTLLKQVMAQGEVMYMIDGTRLTVTREDIGFMARSGEMPPPEGSCAMISDEVAVLVEQQLDSLATGCETADDCFVAFVPDCGCGGPVHFVSQSQLEPLNALRDTVRNMCSAGTDPGGCYPDSCASVDPAADVSCIGNRCVSADAQAPASGCVWGVDALLDEVGAPVLDRTDCGSANIAETSRVQEMYSCFSDLPGDPGAEFTVNYCVDCAIPSTFVSVPSGDFYRITLEEDLLGDSYREATVDLCSALQFVEDDIVCEDSEQLYQCVEPIP